MIRSMTGFGEVERQTASGQISVQVRTVNHRHFHAHFRMPLAAERWESELTQILRGRIARGHVHYRLGFQLGPGGTPLIQLDHDRLSAYLAAFDEIKRRHGLAGDPDLGLVARLGDVFQAGAEEPEQLAFEDVVEATRAAIDRVIEVRETEGKTLAADLLGATAEMRQALDAIVERAPGRLIDERDRLRAAVADLASEVTVEEERLAREIAWLAERWDINEEVVRLGSHIEQFEALLKSESTEPVGKRLGFWIQEMHREANTIGSKANDTVIAGLVVEIKTGIERLREQVENVE
ncbi:MAG: YicC family protein [Gemmatimonadota bacterium]|nr:MAG: YicC family protein [Gemmatimonadota bacterium]